MGEIATVRSEVHAGQDDSLKPAAATRSTSRKHVVERQAAPPPRVVGIMQCEQRSSQPVCTRSVNVVRPATPGAIAAPHGPSPSPNRSAVACSTASEKIGFGLVRRPGPPGQSRDVIRTPRGVATGDDNPRRGILAGDSSDRLSGALIGRSGHRAGIDDDDIGFR